MATSSHHDYYKQLEGFKIHKFLGEDKDGFPEFILTKPRYEKVKIAVSADPEGNYGGFLFIMNGEDNGREQKVTRSIVNDTTRLRIQKEWI